MAKYELKTKVNKSSVEGFLNSVKDEQKRARYAFEIFCYRIKKYLGAYAAVMGGLDALVFTGGIGENAPEVRSEVCRNMEFIGIKLDEIKNENHEELISDASSKVSVFRIPTNEELVIALDTSKIVGELVH